MTPRRSRPPPGPCAQRTAPTVSCASPGPPPSSSPSRTTSPPVATTSSASASTARSRSIRSPSATPTRASRSPTPAASPPPSPPPLTDAAAGRPGSSVSAMEHRTLGRTGMYVSPLCLGAMMFGDWGNKDHDESVRIIHRALDAGINFIDTADVYSRGESEEIVGSALKDRRDDVILATKVHGTMGDDPNQFGNSRRWIAKECDASLKRLGTDWIDLYQIHRPEQDTDIDETLGALTDLVRAGKVRAIGSSTFPPSQIVEAQWTAERRGRERFMCEQPPYSLLVREVEREVLPVCQKYGMGVIPWSPLAGGYLSGRYKRGEEPPKSSRAERLPHRFDLSIPANQRKFDAAVALGELAEDAGMTLIELALAFVIRHPGVTAAIIGPRTMEHLESQLTAADVTLSDDVLDRIDEIVPPGTTVNPVDLGWSNPALEPAARRR